MKYTEQKCVSEIKYPSLLCKIQIYVLNILLWKKNPKQTLVIDVSNTLVKKILSNTCLRDRFIKDACVSNEKYQTHTKWCKMVPKSTSQLMVGKIFNRTPDLSKKYINCSKFQLFPLNVKLVHFYLHYFYLILNVHKKPQTYICLINNKCMQRFRCINVRTILSRSLNLLTSSG